MDWIAFFFGAVVGAFLAALAVALLTARVISPFIRAAKERTIRTASMVPPTRGDADAN
jgi:hypothetical protein